MSNFDHDSDLSGDLQTIVNAARFPWRKAPSVVRDRARAIYEKRQASLMQRVGFNLGFAGARSAGVMERAQVSYEFEGVQARLLFSLEGKQWRVMGRVASGSPEWLALIEDQPMGMDENGQFEGFLKAIPQEVVILSPHQTYLLPIRLED